MKKTKIYMTVLCIMLFFASCTGSKNNYSETETTVSSEAETKIDVSETEKASESETETVTTTKSWNDLTIYSEEQLKEINNFEGTLDELDELYPIEFKRNWNVSYGADWKYFETIMVFYRGENNIVILNFYKDGKKMLSDIYSAEVLEKDFEALKIGDDVNDVINIDPNGSYYVLFIPASAYPPNNSIHYTKDGYIVQITYDSDKKVEKIEKEPILQ